MHTTLAIETSCDDTSIALVQRDGDDFSVELMRAASSIADHQKYGGVVPEIASRRHSEDIIPLIESFGYDRIASVDSISVTTHPGLPGSLAVGRTMAQLLSQWFDIPHIPINHIHGHIFSILLERNLTDLPRPWMVLSVSGGHNDIYLVEEKDKRDEKGAKGTQGTQGAPDIVGDFTIARLGRTLDDASGEAFDKVARMLGGPYPGGPWIGQQAAAHTPRDDSPFRFPRVFLSKADHERNFSFS
jgi:N6-L-threonylcarbamoyladenine synthase